jgi:hypothetical protein
MSDERSLRRQKRSALWAILDENTQQVFDQPGTRSESENIGFNFVSHLGDFGESPGDVTFVDKLGIFKIVPDEVGHDGTIVIERGDECLDDTVFWSEGELSDSSVSDDMSVSEMSFKFGGFGYFDESN